jgi:hypothetical protein
MEASNGDPAPSIVAPSTIHAEPPITTAGEPCPPAAAPIATGGVAAPIGGGFLDGLGVWVGAEYLMYFVKGSPLPFPLVTNGLNDNAFPGVLGQSGTRTLLGSQSVNEATYHGLRGRVGFDLGDSGFGMEAVGFVLDQASTHRSFPNSTTNPSVLGLPFFNVNRGEEAVLLVRVPDGLNGSTSFHLRTNLAGAELNAGYNVNAGVVDWAFIGYRYLNLTERLAMQSRFTTLDTAVAFYRGVPVPTGINGEINDSFATSNTYQGAQVGFIKRIAYGITSLEVRSSVGFGNTRQRVRVQGDSSVSTPTVLIDRVPGGLFAQQSNIGTVVTNQFSVIPEVGVNVHVRLLENVIGVVGYNFLYWNNVLRVGDAMDRNIELQQVPFSRQYTGVGAGLPGIQYRRSDLTVHGLNVGLEVRF